jgi:hypothetical protein
MNSNYNFHKGFYDMVNHPDGSRCRKGKQVVPSIFTPCCPEFQDHTMCCEYDIRYEWWRKSNRWVIVISDYAGGGGIEIHFCPHCGTPLPSDNKGVRNRIRQKTEKTGDSGAVEKDPGDTR